MHKQSQYRTSTLRCSASRGNHCHQYCGPGQADAVQLTAHCSRAADTAVLQSRFCQSASGRQPLCSLLGSRQALQSLSHLLMQAFSCSLQCGLVTFQSICSLFPSTSAFTVCNHCLHSLSAFTVCMHLPYSHFIHALLQLLLHVPSYTVKRISRCHCRCFSSAFSSSALCMHFGEQMLHVHAEANIVLVVYAHRVKQFQEESGGDPSAVLIPALLDKTVPVQPLSDYYLFCQSMLQGKRVRARH